MEPKKKANRPIIVAIVVIAVIAVAVVAYAWWTQQQDTQKWYFKGAYGTYVGEITRSSETMSFLMRMEVVDLNSTHLQILVGTKMSSETLGTLLDEQETNWVPIKDVASLSMEEMEGYTIDKTYEDYAYIEGLGTKYCKIYEFSITEIPETQMTMTVYVDPDLEWPLKFSFYMDIADEPLIFNINLTDTNIPALQ